MKKSYKRHLFFQGFIIMLSLFYQSASAQVYEWRLHDVVYNSTDPDGAGPATGIVKFSLQMRQVAGSRVLLTAISTGYSVDSNKVILPEATNCEAENTPQNIELSPAFLAAGFNYQISKQCNAFTQTVAGQSFNKTTSGTLESSVGINIDSSFTDVYTVTLWTLGFGKEAGGYAIINSGSLGTPGSLANYTASDNTAREFVANSLTFNNPIALGVAAVTDLPDVPLSSFSIKLYPVPARDVLNVVIKSEKRLYTTLQLYDLTGRCVRTQQVLINNGVNNFRFDVSGLPSGNYLIRSANEGFNFSGKLIVVH